jgi:hypothetical protein
MTLVHAKTDCLNVVFEIGNELVMKYRNHATPIFSLINSLYARWVDFFEILTDIHFGLIWGALFQFNCIPYPCPLL